MRILSRIGCLSLEQAREDLDLIRACNARILEVYSLDEGESTWKDFVILTLTARISESCLEEDVDWVKKTPHGKRRGIKRRG